MMKLEDLAANTGLHFDSGLKVFDKLMTFYLDAPERVLASGRKVIAKDPPSPPEVIYAAGAVAYGISTCEGIMHSVIERRTDISSRAAEFGISPDFSSWNTTMLLAAMEEKLQLPVSAYSAMIGSCGDQLVKSLQLMAKKTSCPLRFWEVPAYDPDSEKVTIAYLKKELEQQLEWISFYTGHKAREDNLHRTIAIGNQLRQDMAQINSYLAKPKVPMSGLEYYLLQMMMGDYGQDPEGLHVLYQKLIDELQDRAGKGQAAPAISDLPVRIYLMGEETQQLSLFNAIEDYGGVVVGCDFRLPLYYDTIDENKSPLEALARQIWHMPSNKCPAERVMQEIPFIQKQQPDAVIINSTTGSRYISESARMIADTVKQELGLPVLYIETAFPGQDIEKIEYQIRAFLETIA